jgi:hypothetical protein
MSIVVNPHNREEEQALLAFLNSGQYDYSLDDENSVLTEIQQNELQLRDEEFEAGSTESYCIDEIVAHFHMKEK